jgi:hypothetical protein
VAEPLSSPKDAYYEFPATLFSWIIPVNAGKHFNGRAHDSAVEVEEWRGIGRK